MRAKLDRSFPMIDVIRIPSLMCAHVNTQYEELGVCFQAAKRPFCAEAAGLIYENETQVSHNYAVTYP